MINPKNSSPNIVVAYMNIRGQSGLNFSKQKQIEAFINVYKPDILNLQEVNIADDTFENCDKINSTYNIISNNAINKYGTASLVSSDLQTSNIKFDSEGRMITFDVENATFANVYLPSGNNQEMKNSRENYAAKIIPELLINSKDVGVIGGDWNCIVCEKDATKNAAQKMSKSLKRLVKNFCWNDSFRTLNPCSQAFSRYYESDQFGDGATRIDRQYHWGSVEVLEAKYIGVAFSDHMSLILTLKLPENFSRILSPKYKAQFKSKPDVVRDPEFYKRLKHKVSEWSSVKDQGVDVMLWWEQMVKPGIKRLLIDRGKEIKQERSGILNLLLLRQTYLVRKIQAGDLGKLSELKQVQSEIEHWHFRECEKIKLQARTDELNKSEKVRIYHHELHSKHLKKSSILKLQTESGLIEGHDKCVKYLEKAVSDLLTKPANLDLHAQEQLLKEVKPVFTKKDNDDLKKVPSKDDVKDSVWSSNLDAAPGSDGLSMLVYKHCWEILGDGLTEMVQAVLSGASPSLSQRTSLMVYGAKSNKPPNSIDPNHKRRISLLNSDFKVITGCVNKKFKKVATHTLSPHQLSAGDDRRIHHGINRARDAIMAAGSKNDGVGILDNDYKAAFDYMVLTWVLKVLLAKGLDQEIINSILNIYGNNLTVVVVNNIQGSCFPNTRWSIRQGDRPSSLLFCYGLDPHLDWLENRLRGISTYTSNFFSPSTSTENYKLMAYVDDVKPSVTSMQEFLLIDQGSALFEAASGCILHRDPASGKVKFLPLGRWRGTLTREDLPVKYIVMSEHLDMVGVKLMATFLHTRKVNCDDLQNKVKNVIGPWKGGKFMPLSQRSHSINTYCLSKIWFKCPSINLRLCDQEKMTAQVKSWLFQDQLEKPEDFVLYRPRAYGGLGLIHIESKALALQIRSFMETSANPAFKRNIFHEALYKWHLEYDRSIPNPGLPPYYPDTFFAKIRQVKEEGLLNITTMSTATWYKVLLENFITHEVNANGIREYRACKIETKHPDVDWDRTWSLAVTPGLCSDSTSFLWRMIHSLLPTRERLDRMNMPGTTSSICDLCDLEAVDTTLHALLQCPFSNPPATFLMSVFHSLLPNLQPAQVVFLDFDVATKDKLPLTFMTASVLSQIWSSRKGRKSCNLQTIRANLEASIQILRKSRHHQAATRIDEILMHVDQ